MKRLMTLTACLWSAIAFAQSTPSAPADSAAVLERGKQVAGQVCAACHGADGNSPTAANPSLAGQHADYITQQLSHFKSGVRANAIMQGMAQPLSDEDMRALGLFYSRQAPKGMTARDAALVRVGQAMWRGGDATRGVPACGACHSPTGAGIPKSYPRIAGQYADYTYAQLKAFQAGERGRDKAGKDVNGAIMGSVARSLTDAEMKALAEYAAGLR